MRRFAILLISATAFAQAPLIGVNSAAAELPAGAREIIASITADPSPSGGDFLAVMLSAEGVGIEIELPDGRRITKESAPSLDFEWEIAEQGQGDDLLFPGLQGKVNHLIILPAKAPAGKYLIHADASALKKDAALMLVFLPLGEPASGAAGERDTVRVAVTSVDTFHYTDEKVQLVAGVFDGDRGVDNARLTSQAVAVDENGSPQGRPMIVQFRPSGPGADGSFVAELPATAAGEYLVSVKVQGKYPDGTDFERDAGTTIKIEPRRARILSVTETPVDEDGNGLIDRIDVTAHVKVELPGEYFLTIDLKAGDSKYMQESGKAILGVGEGTITAQFDRYSLTHVGADGPYKIEARLSRKEGEGLGFASLLENAGATRAYKISSFDRGPLYFVGTAGTTLKSAIGRAPFDQLIVNFDVFTPGGDCEWSGGLQSGKIELEYLSNGGRLPKGSAQISLTIEGLEISDRADGKTLETRGVRIQCHDLEAKLEKPVTLPLFPTGTFLKPPPSFEILVALPETRVTVGGKGIQSLQVKTVGGFDQILDFSVEGLPAGVIALKAPRSRPAQEINASFDYLYFELAVAPDASPGSYPITLRAKGKTMERSKKATLTLVR